VQEAERNNNLSSVYTSYTLRQLLLFLHETIQASTVAKLLDHKEILGVLEGKIELVNKEALIAHLQYLPLLNELLKFLRISAESFRHNSHRELLSR